MGLCSSVLFIGVQNEKTSHKPYPRIRAPHDRRRVDGLAIVQIAYQGIKRRSNPQWPPKIIHDSQNATR